MTVDEVLHEVLKDVKFYKKSGGGVTLSGGEPLAQPRFCRRTLPAVQRGRSAHHARHLRIRTLVRASRDCWNTWTSFFSTSNISNAAKHAEATGRDNRLILENAKKIAKLKPMRVRVPLIPGFNDSVETVGEIVRFAKDELGCPDIDLLPYNRLGEIKFDFLDKPCPALPSQTDDHLRMLEALRYVRFSDKHLFDALPSLPKL